LGRWPYKNIPSNGTVDIYYKEFNRRMDERGMNSLYVMHPHKGGRIEVYFSEEEDFELIDELKNIDIEENPNLKELKKALSNSLVWVPKKRFNNHPLAKKI